MSSPVVLIVFNERENRYFYTPQVKERITAIVPQAVWKEAPANESAWLQMLEEIRPEVIYGAWSMPPLHQRELAACPSLRYVCLVTGTFRHLVESSYFDGTRQLSNWGDAAAPMVAECALALTLACLRQVNEYAMALHVDRTYPARSEPLPRSLIGRRVGIHGFGAVARHLLPMLQPFKTTVQVYSAPVAAAVYARHGVQRAPSIEALFADNEIIIEAEALTPQTRGSVSKALIDSMPMRGIFVNVARGPLVDEQALIARALKGEISLGLDVYVREPLPEDSPLRGMRNAVLLPHTAGPTVDHYPQIALRALNNLEHYLSGKPLPDARSLADYLRST